MEPPKTHGKIHGQTVTTEQHLLGAPTKWNCYQRNLPAYDSVQTRIPRDVGSVVILVEAGEPLVRFP